MENNVDREGVSKGDVEFFIFESGKRLHKIWKFGFNDIFIASSRRYIRS